jgi:hypothetical protein
MVMISIPNNKTCFILCHGESLNILEKCIDRFKDLDVIWGSMSTFDIPQKYILNKINKTFSIVYDSSTVENAISYELTVRIPRLVNYLDESIYHYYICTKTDRNNLYELRNSLGLNFNEKYKNQIIYAEDLGINPNLFCVSLHLYIACLIKLGFENIVLFGADGGGIKGNSIESYYKWELVKEDKIQANNLYYNMVGDTNNINTTFEPIMRQIFGKIPVIINCSPNTTYNVFHNTTYTELLNKYGI